MNKRINKPKEKWEVSKKIPSAIISDKPIKNTLFPVPPNPEYSRESDLEYYGGYCVCESLGNSDHAKLIAAAPRMLEALKQIAYCYWTDGETDGEKVDDLKSVAMEVIEIIESPEGGWRLFTSRLPNEGEVINYWMVGIDRCVRLTYSKHLDWLDGDKWEPIDTNYYNPNA